MLKNNWKKLAMLKKTMLLFFMPLLINYLIKIILKIRIYSGRCSIQLLQVCLLPEEKTKELPKEAFDTSEENVRVADDFGFSETGVDLNLHYKGTPSAGVRHLRDETLVMGQ